MTALAAAGRHEGRRRRLLLETIDDLEGLTDLGGEWRDLWTRCSAASPFQHPDWLIAWWRAFSPGRLAVIAARNDDRLVALAPLYSEESGGTRRLLPVGISVSDILDVLVDPEAPPDAVAAFAEGIAALRFDRLDIPDLPQDADALRLPFPPDLAAAIEAGEPSPVLALGDDDALGFLPARKRRQIRRARAAAERRGAVSIESMEGDPDRFLDHLVRLHGLRWRSRGESGVLDDPRVLRLHREALPGLVDEGIARCRVIRIGDDVAAAYYGFHRGDRASAYLGGFDPEFAGESPGSLLMADAIADAVRDGARSYHFLRGDEDYKYRWGAEPRCGFRLSVRRRPAS